MAAQLMLRGSKLELCEPMSGICLVLMVEHNDAKV